MRNGKGTASGKYTEYCAPSDNKTDWVRQMDNHTQLKKEREYSYMIAKDNIPVLFKAIVDNRKNFYAGDSILMLEKGSKKKDMQLLASDHYSATRSSDGTRHRIKLQLGKKKPHFTHSVKHFINGSRYEEELEQGNSMEKLRTILCTIPAIDCVLVKCCIKYRFVNHVNGDSIIIRIDGCYAVNPADAQMVAEPYFCLELEECRGIRLEDFVKCKPFMDEIRPLVSDMAYESHNRIRIAKARWPEGKLEEAAIESYLSKIREQFMNRSEELDPFAGLADLYLRGDKSVERGNKEEIEYKFFPKASVRDVISIIRDILPPGFAIIKTAPRVITDIYFDTEDCLLRNAAQFRIRRRKKGTGWIACFKQPEEATEDCIVREKRRSMVTDREAIQFYSGDQDVLTGAFGAVRRYMTEVCGSDQNLLPSLLLHQYRDRYAIRYQRNVLQMDDSDAYSYSMSDMVHIIFDTVEAIDLLEADINYLLQSNELDITKAEGASAHFFSAEIESNLRSDVKEQSQRIFDLICGALCQSSDIETLKWNKYQLGVDQLSIQKG